MSEPPRSPFYASRTFRAILLCAVPILLLGGAWWAVDAFVLAPPYPAADATAEAYVRFLEDERGLPRLRGQRLDGFIEQLLRRLSGDTGFQQQFIATVRALPGEQLDALKEHIFDAFKPRFMNDARSFRDAPDEAKTAFLDEKIVHYTRIERTFKGRSEDRQKLDRLLSEQEIKALILRKMSREELALGAPYVAAIADRAEQIKRDPQLRERIDARIAAP